ncbi:MAG TPA: PASTA domain-containing protein, partial [Acidimicrobiales bacterium]|nr:PASTA domain-containing protein [Acidimicrobiales bacterium]
RGLDYAHRRGLVHRDIKPANLLFDDDGRLRIGDFGLARALAEAAWTEPIGTVLGTARYAAPEQVSGAPIDGKSDVYSLALVLVEAVTGRVPFAADTTVATLMGRLDRPIEAPPELGPLAAVVGRAGRPDPAERLDAAGLASALQSAALGLPTPEPLPLAGPATVDEVGSIADPTDVGPRPGGPAPTPPPPRQTSFPQPAAVPSAYASAPAFAPASAPSASAADATVSVATGSEPTGASPALVGAAAGRGFAGAGDATIVEAPVAPTQVSRRIEPQPYVETGPPLSKAGRRRRRRWPYLVLLLVLLAGGGGAGAYLVLSNRVPTHPLPSVIDQPELQAATTLRNLKFDVEIQQEFFDGSVPGVVKLQDPPGGGSATLEEGQKVTLVVSKGPAPTPVPDLAGLDEDGARKVLDGVGHVLGAVTTTNHETIERGLVLDWTLKGESPPKGATVDVVVSAGPAAREVPNLLGKTYDEAAATLVELGLEAERIEIYTDDDGAAGRVVTTAPAAGESATRGSLVTVTVSRGQPAVPKLSGLSGDEAAAALQAQGLSVGSRFGPANGEVFLSLPSEGTKVKPGASVTIYLL